MQRQRDSLVPIAEALSGLDKPLKAIREASCITLLASLLVLVAQRTLCVNRRS